MLEAAVAWDGLAVELALAADTFNSVTAGLVGSPWQGAASQAMSAAAAPYVEWLTSATAHAEEAALQARAVVNAFDAVRAAMVHPALVAANRADLLALAQSNVFGLNAPAIAAAEAEYERMWALDVAGMFDYRAEAAAAVSALTPLAQPLQGLPGLASQILGGGQAAAPRVPAATFTTLNLFDGILNFNIGTGGIQVTISTPAITLPTAHIPPINTSAFNLPQLTIPPINIPAGSTPKNVIVSPFTLPQLSIPSIDIPAGSTPTNITVGAFKLPQITTPAISVPAISLPTVTIPAFQTPLIQVTGWSLPSITVPQITIPKIQFPDVNVAGNNQTIVTLNTDNVLFPNYSINLQSFDVTTSLGFTTQGYVQQFSIPSIQIGALTLPTLAISNPNGGPYVFPSIELSGFTVPSLTVPPVEVSGFTLPQISWPAITTAPLTISPIGVGEITLPQISWPAITTAPLTISPIGIGGLGLPAVDVPNITLAPVTLAEFTIQPVAEVARTLNEEGNGLITLLKDIEASLFGTGA
jgi:PPE-repeat protein